MKTKCGECNGTGKLTRLGGDWGKTPDREVECWKCKGTGKSSDPMGKDLDFFTSVPRPGAILYPAMSIGRKGGPNGLPAVQLPLVDLEKQLRNVLRVEQLQRIYPERFDEKNRRALNRVLQDLIREVNRRDLNLDNYRPAV